MSSEDGSEPAPAPPLPESQWTTLDQIDLSLRCLHGVASADLVWLLTFPENGTGAFIEYGYALGLEKITVVSGTMRTIFQTMSMPLVFSTHDEAAEWIAQTALPL